MTTPTAEASTAGARSRPARRPIDELSLSIDATTLEVVGADGPAWLVGDRREAFERYAALPAESNLLYTPYIDLRSAKLDDARFASGLTGSPAGVPLPAGTDGLLEITDGRATAFALSPAAVAAGVRLATLPSLIATDPDRARTLLLDGVGLPDGDRFAQLTRALWTQGVILEVPASARLEHPIVVRWGLGAADRALASRTLVHVGAGAHVALVEELVEAVNPTPDGGQSFFAGSMEVVLEAEAGLTVASLQELPAHVVAFQHRRAAVGEGASLHWALAQLGGRLVRSRVDNRLVGDRSSVEQVEIVFGGDEQLFDLTSYTTHVGRDTTGDLLSKGALLDHARSYMKGLITIEQSAVGTDSFLGEFGMNLSKAARSVAIPSLEIDQPDCRRAAHSSSVGPIDEAQLFYLESRGIPADEARKFIVLGFLEPVVARVPLATAQARLRELLEEKWVAGTLGTGGAAA
jgi:Fe-S cluster assembly scaffold protein SufB